jgi:hypothetical protein
MVRWPIVLMVIGLLLAAGAAGLMAFRPPRRVRPQDGPGRTRRAARYRHR